MRTIKVVIITVLFMANSLLSMENGNSQKGQEFGTKLIAAVHGEYGVALEEIHARVQRLIESKSVITKEEINWQDAAGDTALMYAAGYADTDLCRLLIDHEAEVYGCNHRGKTPLHAAFEQSLITTEFILEAMLRTSIPFQKERVMTFMYCMKQLYPTSYPHMRHFFKPILRQLIFEQKELRAFKVVRRLPELTAREAQWKQHIIEKYFKWFYQKNKKSALMIRAGAGDIKLCKWLIEERKLDIHYANAAGITALHEAALCGWKNVCEFLLERGAYVFCRDREDQSPLAKACIPAFGLSEKVKRKEVAEYLCEQMLKMASYERVLAEVIELSECSIKSYLLEKYFPNHVQRSPNNENN